MKYDLARMLAEIEEDEKRPRPAPDRKLTQEQIRALRREMKSAVTPPEEPR